MKNSHVIWKNIHRDYLRRMRNYKSKYFMTHSFGHIE